MSVISDVKAAYNLYRVAKLATATAQAAILTLGPIPEFGDIIVTDPDYDDVVAARAAWNASMVTLRATLATRKATELTHYGDVLAAGLWLNQWVELSGLSVSPTTAYIGIADSNILQSFLNGNPSIGNPTSLPPIIELTAAPANNFPDQTPA